MRIRTTPPAHAALTAAIAFALALSGQSTAAQPALRGAVTTTKLENGLQVIVIRNPSIPFVTLELVVRAGASIQTTDDLQGVPHLLEHMVFRSGDEGDFEKKASDIDAMWNGVTGSESVSYFLTFPSKHLEKGMELLSDLVRKPYFSEKAIETERKVVQGELERRASEPLLLLRTESDVLLWEGSGWQVKNPGGHMIALMQAKPDLLKLLHKKFYVPNNAALIIAGDVTDSVGFDLANRIFRGWKSGPDPIATLPPPKIPALTAIKRKVLTREVKDVTILARWQGPSTIKDRSATYAADVFAGLVNQPLSGTQRRLVDAGLVDAVSLRYQTLNHVGPIELQVRTSPDRVVAAVEAIGAELSKLTQPDYFSDADLKLAKKRQQVYAHYQFESASSSAHVLAEFWSSADLDYFIGYADSLEVQTRENIQRFVDTYVKEKPMAVVILISEDGWRASSAALQRAVGAWRVP